MTLVTFHTFKLNKIVVSSLRNVPPSPLQPPKANGFVPSFCCRCVLLVGCCWLLASLFQSVCFFYFVIRFSLHFPHIVFIGFQFDSLLVACKRRHSGIHCTQDIYGWVAMRTLIHDLDEANNRNILHMCYYFRGLRSPFHIKLFETHTFPLNEQVYIVYIMFIRIYPKPTEMK